VSGRLGVSARAFVSSRNVGHGGGCAALNRAPLREHADDGRARSTVRVSSSALVGRAVLGVATRGIVDRADPFGALPREECEMDYGNAQPIGNNELPSQPGDVLVVIAE
jgi:hypothetical protein